MEPIYIVTDVRTVPEGNAVLITSTQHSSRQSAESLYFSKLATAANPDSQYPHHAVTLMTNEGFVLETRHYEHEITPPEPEPEPEPPEQEPEQEPGNVEEA